MHKERLYSTFIFIHTLLSPTCTQELFSWHLSRSTSREEFKDKLISQHITKSQLATQQCQSAIHALSTFSMSNYQQINLNAKITFSYIASLLSISATLLTNEAKSTAKILQWLMIKFDCKSQKIPFLTSLLAYELVRY